MRMHGLLLGALVSATLGCRPQYDLVILDGAVLDGTGAPAQSVDVGVRDGVIARVGDLDGAPARRVINAAGKHVTPGFIDMMGVNSLVLIKDPKSAWSKLYQGISTMMAGEGSSHAPHNDKTLEPVKIGAKTYTWTRFSEYFEIIEEQGVPLNLVHNVGAAQIREVVLGEDDVDPTPAQLEQMKALVVQAMEDGAVGLSSSLIYPPGVYADVDELSALASAASPYDAVYFTHMRNESGQLIEAIEESLEIGRRGGVGVHIYHLKAAGADNWPLMEKAIATLQAARDAGEDVTADVYPYIRNGIGMESFIHPRHSANGEAAFLATLGDPALRATLRQEIEADGSWENWYHHVGKSWDKVLITKVSEGTDKALVGLSVQQVAAHRGVDVWDAFFDLAQTGETLVAPESMDEGQKHLAMKAPFVCFDNDTRPTNPDAVTSQHPRAFGAFPRVLAKYVREEQVIPLPEAVRKLTSLPASILRLKDRGTIAEGMAADIVVFDPATIRDTATFSNPLSYAEGVDYLIVNGVAVIDGGTVTKAKPGAVLRRGR